MKKAFPLFIIIILALLSACSKDPDHGHPQDSTNILTSALFYEMADTTAPPYIDTIYYTANHKIDRIIQTFAPTTDTPSIWKFTYFPNGDIATIKGNSIFWFAAQDFTFYYSSGRLDSILTKNTGLYHDSTTLNTVYAYDANNHIKHGYSYYSEEGTGVYAKKGDTLSSFNFYRSNHVDSFNFVSPIQDGPDAFGNIQFDPGPGKDLSALDKAFVFFMSLRNSFAPTALEFSPILFQYLNPDVKMVKGGTFTASYAPTHTYNFTTTTGVHGRINSMLIKSNSELGYSLLVKLHYAQ